MGRDVLGDDCGRYMSVFGMLLGAICGAVAAAIAAGPGDPSQRRRRKRKGD